MRASYSYSSIAVHMFDLWRIVLAGIPIFLLVYLLIGIPFPYNLFISILSVIIIVVVMLYLNHTEIIRNGNSLSINHRNISITLNGIQSIETWWQYDIGISSNVLTRGNTAETRSHINVILVYAEITAKHDKVLLYEKIQMSSYFPNNHRYRHDKSIHKKGNIVKVGSIDKCIQTLKLTDFK